MTGIERNEGFTLLEAIVSVAIFCVLMIAVMALWNVSWRAAERISQGGYADRHSEIATKRLVEAIEASVYHRQQKALYEWRGEDDNGGTEESDQISFVTSLPPDVAESSAERAPLERVLIMAGRSEDGKRQLILKAAPLTMEENDWQRETVLLENLGAFRVRYWSNDQRDWVDGWKDDEHAPSAVQVGITLKGEPADSKLDDWQHRCVARVYPPIRVPQTAEGTSTNAPPEETTPSPLDGGTDNSPKGGNANPRP